VFGDRMLQEFVDTFYGYGDYRSPIWFVGIEEGGGKTFDDIRCRVTSWAARGRLELENLQSYHQAIGLGKFFREKPRPPLQSYWRRIMRMTLIAGSRVPRNDEMRIFQRTALGNSAQFICILELMPIACKSTRTWPLFEHTKVRSLEDKGRYIDEIAPKRAKHIAAQINKHRPKVVVFCSSDARYRKYWNSIAQLVFKGHPTLAIETATNRHTKFVIMSHPSARGFSDSEFDSIGRYVAPLHISV
jgi:hypothetical protein